MYALFLSAVLSGQCSAGVCRLPAAGGGLRPAGPAAVERRPLVPVVYAGVWPGGERHTAPAFQRIAFQRPRPLLRLVGRLRR